MTIAHWLILLPAILMITATIASVTKYDHWWIRGFDFPRLQISVITAVVVMLTLLQFSFQEFWHYLLLALLLTSFSYQAVKIFPYTFLARKQVFRYTGKNGGAHVSILVSNVLTPNQKYKKLLDLVEQYQPDILLTLETDKKWENQLSKIESHGYEYTVKIPQDNLYGMHLFSKLPLSDVQVKFLISKEIPSIHAFITLRNGHKVNIRCLHPKPPSPSEDDTSTNRDAELLLIGKEIKKQVSTVVIGDLNDVAWSRTTRLFQKISGLLDPRIGRGFYNTYHAAVPLFRWPLDHVFHSSDFSLVKLKRLPFIGSDHFPIFIELYHQTMAKDLNDQPEKPEEEEREWADEKIRKGEK